MESVISLDDSDSFGIESLKNEEIKEVPTEEDGRLYWVIWIIIWLLCKDSRYCLDEVANGSDYYNNQQIIINKNDEISQGCDEGMTFTTL